MEKELWKIVKEYQKKDATKKDELIIRTFVNETRFEQICDEASLEHVAHPMNAFQALKRTTKTWEETLLKIGNQNKLKNSKQLSRRFPERFDFEEGASFGLMTLQENIKALENPTESEFSPRLFIECGVMVRTLQLHAVKGKHLRQLNQ